MNVVLFTASLNRLYGSKSRNKIKANVERRKCLMSVPKSEQNESKVAFYMKALEIRIGLIKLFCRNLGLKNGIKDVNVYAQKMS